MQTGRLRRGWLPALGALFLLTGASLGLSSLVRPGEIGRAASEEGDKVTIIALYPSVGTVKDLMALRKYGLIDIPNLKVVGVYHEKEETDYEKSKDFAAGQGLDWITFHPISAPISAETVFLTNACTPEFEELFDLADGIIFFGGPDIPPCLYGEEANFLTIIEDPYRHFLEVSFIFHLLGGRQDDGFRPLLERRPDFPVLGLCLGCQSLNVGAGGTLIQDIWSEAFGVLTVEDAIALGPSGWHSNPYSKLLPQEQFSGFVFHEIELAGEGRFQKEIGWKRKDRPLVFSSHHQQAEELGKGFRVIASSPDGKVIEAIEHERYRHVLGVQFHPEAWVLFDSHYRAKFTPSDKEPFSVKAYLEERPKSLAFHRKLWSWVARGWVESRRSRAR